jgi:hypothetical protein
MLNGEERVVIRMLFPVSGLVDYIIGLYIYESKVGDLTISLFKV